MDGCGQEFARRFASAKATKVLTAEISGIAPALFTAMHLGLPVVYARKTKPITMPDQVYLTLAPSHTKGRMVELIISPEHLRPGERILIIDDFLASGATILGLVRLAQTAGAEIVGIGALIEKRSKRLVSRSSRWRPFRRWTTIKLYFKSNRLARNVMV
jgi:xanthine phosphoribosyltransferase